MFKCTDGPSSDIKAAAIHALAIVVSLFAISAFAQTPPKDRNGGEAPRTEERRREPGKPDPNPPDPKKGRPDGATAEKKSGEAAKPKHKLTKGGDLETPVVRAKKLRDLYAELAAAGSAEDARKVTSNIERLWFRAESDTVIALMQRAEAALGGERFDLALNLLNRAVEISPDYPEVWNRRAYAHYLSGDHVRAVGDLRRVLALDPNHYRALEAYASIMRETGNKPAALAVLRQLMTVHPFAGADQAIKELTVDVEGQKL